MKTLQNLMDNGDPLFSLDVIFDKPETKQIVVRAVTSASKIISSLANGSNAILVRGVTDGPRRAEYDRLIREADSRRNPGFRCSTVLNIFRTVTNPCNGRYFTAHIATSASLRETPAQDPRVGRERPD